MEREVVYPSVYDYWRQSLRTVKRMVGGKSVSDQSGSTRLFTWTKRQLQTLYDSSNTSAVMSTCRQHSSVHTPVIVLVHSDRPALRKRAPPLHRDSVLFSLHFSTPHLPKPKRLIHDTRILPLPDRRHIPRRAYQSIHHRLDNLEPRRPRDKWR